MWQAVNAPKNKHTCDKRSASDWMIGLSPFGLTLSELLYPVSFCDRLSLELLVNERRVKGKTF